MRRKGIATPQLGRTCNERLPFRHNSWEPRSIVRPIFAKKPGLSMPKRYTICSCINRANRKDGSGQKYFIRASAPSSNRHASTSARRPRHSSVASLDRLSYRGRSQPWTQARAAARAFARHVGLPLQPLTVLVYFCQHAFAHGLGGPCAARNDANKISTAGTTSITNRFFSLSMVKTSLKIWHPLWTLS